MAELMAGYRKEWVALIAMARTLAHGAVGAGTPHVARDQGALAMDFRRRIGKLKPASFPSRGEASAGEMAAAFLAAARAFCVAAAGRRALFAPALAACAQSLDDVLDELRSTEAERWMNRRDQA